MKFIDFSDKAIDCISIEQWRRLAKMERNGFENSSSKESAQNSEVILVCLSYDDGIRRERVSIAPHMAGKAILFRNVGHPVQVTDKQLRTVLIAVFFKESAKPDVVRFVHADIHLAGSEIRRKRLEYLIQKFVNLFVVD